MPMEKDCGPKCRSRRHVGDVTSLLTSPSCTLRQFQAYAAQCHAWPRLADKHGRTALHLAASCNHWEIVHWLLEEGLADLGVKDMESGHTALHRALFYGQLTCARLLIQCGSDMHVRDVEGLSPLDIVMLDKPTQISFHDNEPNEVYSYGENYNSTLGHPSPHKRTTPEAIDHFKKIGVSIKQTILCKYHCVFLSQCGKVYTCGHGQGGRLGHGDQHTVLVPRLLEELKYQTCLEVAAATDHTVLRMEGSVLYSFGINLHQQLGQTPYVESCPTPKQMNLKALKGRGISGVCVGRFHTVVWTPDSVFTVGLNAGQLGVPRGEKYQGQLRQVSSLRHTDIGISLVACSDAATVCLTTKGDIYVLHEYQCRKIASKWQEVRQVVVTGGNLDHNTGLDILTERGGHDLHIAIRNDAGQMFLWRSNSPNLKRCQFALKRQVAVRDVSMTTSCLVFSSTRGEAFVGYLSNKKSSSGSKDAEIKHSKELKDCGDGFNQPRLLDLLLREEVEDIQVRRLPGIHRATRVAADRKGRNFAVMQVLPNGCLSEIPAVTSSDIQDQFGRLLSEADLGDTIHDVIVEAGGQSWPCHKYILAMRSDHFRNIVLAKENNRGTADAPLVIKVPSVSADVMSQALAFIYTDSCDYLRPGTKVKHVADAENIHQKPETIDFDTRGMSAFQVQQKKHASKVGTTSGKKAGHHKNNNGVSESLDVSNLSPIHQLQEVARRLGVKGLSRRLESVKCQNGVIVAQGKRQPTAQVKLDCSKLPELYDVTIRSEEGDEIMCHKCVLVSRLEYFYSMLATGWLESGRGGGATVLTLPAPGVVMEILIHFLYTDEAPQLTDCSKEDLLCNVLIVSDQLLATRLKEMCEVALANILSFKNAGELLEFASVYQAHQLRASCHQFISLNLAAMLEGRYLDVLSEETLDELSQYYKSTISGMAYRQMTPSWSGSQATLDELVEEFDSLDASLGMDIPGSGRQRPNTGKQQKRRSKGQRRQSENNNKQTQGGLSPSPSLPRNLSVSSDISLPSEEEGGLAEFVREIKQQHEEQEKQAVRAAAQARTRLKWKPLDQADHARPAVTPILPEDVPDRVSVMKTLAWGGTPGKKEADRPEQQEARATLTSPSPAVGAPHTLRGTSLRSIMEQESQQPASKTVPSSKQRVSWKEVKKQQNKDAREKNQKNNQTSAESSGASAKPGVMMGNPWAPIGKMVKSFRDLMVQEEVSTASQPASLSQSPPPGGTAGRSRLFSWGSPPTSPTSLDNPWQRRGAETQAHAATPSPSFTASSPGPSAAAALDFSAILKDEEEKTETLERATQKPLALIQLEEQAMCELLEHYKLLRSSGGVDTGDRSFTVERVSKKMAAPLWKRQRTTSGTGHLT